MFEANISQGSVCFPTAQTDLSGGKFDHHWTHSRRLKIQGSVNKAPRIYKALAGITSEECIDVDVDALDRLAGPYLKNKRVPPGCGFKTFTSFYTWWSNVRSFFDVASGRRAANAALMKLQDDWAELIAHLTGQTGNPAIFNTQEMLPLLALARECRRRRIAVKELTAVKVAEFAPSLHPTTKTTVRRGYDSVADLRGSNLVPQGLLPAETLLPLQALTAPSVRQVPTLNAGFNQLMEDYIARKVKGQKTAYFGSESRPIEGSGVGPDRAKNIRVAIRWYWHGLVALELVHPDRRIDLSVLTRPVVLHDVVRASETGRLGAICDGDTRRAWARSVIAFLNTVSPGYSENIDETFFEDRALRSGPEEKIDGKFKRETCLGFIKDHALQKRFFSLPRMFFDEAQPLIDNFKNLGPANEGYINKDQHRALDLAIMAALTAINTRFPARLKTLVRLHSGGARPHLLFPDGGCHSKDVLLDVPGYIVKNGHYASGVPLIPSRLVDQRRILLWYIEKAQPLVLKYKPTKSNLRKPEYLFSGLHVETLRRIWRRYASEAGLAITPHMCRHLIASLLYSKGVPIDLIAELLGNEIDTVAKAYTFVDRAAQIQGVMDAQAQIYREIGV